MFKRIPALLLLACLPFAALAQTQGQPQPEAAADSGAAARALPVTKADVVRFLHELPEVAPIEAEMRSLGFSGENLALAVQQTESFYTDPQIADYIAGRVLSFYGGAEMPGSANGLIWPLIARGVGHLPSRELVYYYNIERTMIGAMPKAQCGRAVRDRLSPQAFSDEMSRVAARLETKALREYYRIELKAARLGVGRPPVTLGAPTRTRIERRISEQVDLLVEASEHPERLRGAMVHIDSVSNAQACEIGLMFYQAVMNMRGADQRKALIYIGLP